MRVGSVDAPKTATEPGARSGAKGCGEGIAEAIAAGPKKARASNGETRRRASLRLAIVRLIPAGGRRPSGRAAFLPAAALRWRRAAIGGSGSGYGNGSPKAD